MILRLTNNHQRRSTLQTEVLENRFCLSSVSFEISDIGLPSSLGLSTAIVADVNGDSLQDLIFAAESRVQWLDGIHDSKNRSDRLHVLSNETDVQLLIAEDLDKDGDSDVAVTSTRRICDADGCRQQMHVSWFENLDGVGAFDDGRIIVDRSRIEVIKFADVDGDDDFDMILGGGDQVVVYFNDGEMNFLTSQIVDTLQFSTVATGDFDSDNDVDILVSTIDADTRHNEIRLFENLDGRGTYVRAQTIDADGFYPFDLSMVDLDADGDKDIVANLVHQCSHANCPRDDLVAWYRNDEGSFGSKITIDSTLLNPTSVATGDFDRDGDTDIAVATLEGNVGWFKNNGSAEFSSVVSVSVNSGPNVLAADVELDGDIDLLSFQPGHNGFGQVTWFESLNGKATFSSGDRIEFNDQLYGKLTLADFDGDNDLDIVSFQDGSGFWYENLDGRGRIGRPRMLRSESRELPTFVMSNDLDGDGDLDLLVGTASDPIFRCSVECGQLVWFRNRDGKGDFAPGLVLDNRDSLAAVVIDFDGDGDKDIVASSLEFLPTADAGHFATGGGLAWYENLDGNANYERRVIDENSHPTSIAMADLVDDAKHEIIVADDRLYLYSEVPNGEFRRMEFPSRFTADFVFALDLDRDDDTDIVSSTEFARIRTYENRIDRNDFFGRQVFQRTDLRIEEMVFEDLDNDGDLDAIVASRNTVAWHETLSVSRFKRQQEFNQGQSSPITGIAVGDMDGDSDIDVVYATLGQLILAENRLHDPLPIGDSNQDGVFDSKDLEAVFRGSEYEDNKSGNSIFDEGDWNGDGDFDSSDLVFAFTYGRYLPD